MKVIGIIRNKEDLKRFGNLKLVDGTKIMELYDDNIENHEQIHFPAIVFKFDGADYYSLYNVFAVKEELYLGVLKEQERKVLDTLLSNVVEDTIYSSSEGLVNDAIEYLKEKHKETHNKYEFVLDLYNTLPVVFSFYNKNKLFFISVFFR